MDKPNFDMKKDHPGKEDANDVIELIIGIDLNPDNPHPINGPHSEGHGAKGEDCKDGPDWRTFCTKLLAKLSDEKDIESLSDEELVRAIDEAATGEKEKPESSSDAWSKLGKIDKSSQDESDDEEDPKEPAAKKHRGFAQTAKAILGKPDDQENEDDSEDKDDSHDGKEQFQRGLQQRQKQDEGEATDGEEDFFPPRKKERRF